MRLYMMKNEKGHLVVMIIEIYRW